MLTSTEGQAGQTEETPSGLNRVQIATCLLLLEAAYADDTFEMSERAHILKILQHRYELTEAEAHDLVAAAEEERAASIDLWQYTQLVNENYTSDEKQELVHEIWRVVLADDHLDSHENHLMHSFRRLLRLAPAQLMDAKENVLREKRANG